ncbi:protein of unknown function DUF927 [Candidatus Magnetoovum chiemensis]|nr:protein of unknown function DUF927 [Candidatus Magnetoovum chiemensis]
MQKEKDRLAGGQKSINQAVYDIPIIPSAEQKKQSKSTFDNQLVNYFGFEKCQIIELCGYNNNTDYKKAKTPVTAWKEQFLSDQQIAGILAKNGWLGLVIPYGYSLIDIDDKERGKTVYEGLQQSKKRFIAIRTPNGCQCFFKDAGTVKTQSAKILTLGGLCVDYRIAKKGYIVLPTENTKDREIIHIPNSELDDMPIIFRHIRTFKETDELIEIPINEGRRDDTLFKQACRVKGWNDTHKLKLTADEKYKVLSEMNSFFCKPPLSDKDVKEKIRQADKYKDDELPNEQTADKERAIEYITGTEFGIIDESFYRIKSEKEYIPLSKFTSRITKTITKDDGLNKPELFYEMETKTIQRRLPNITIRSNQLPALNWVTELGNDAIIKAGQGKKDYIREAIQEYSEYIGYTRETQYTHTGWRIIDGNWRYLHAGGAVGAKNIIVSLPKEIECFKLPELNKDCLRESLEAAYSLLEIATPEITYPLFATIFLTPLTTLLKSMPSFITYLYGHTGSFKTTFAELALAFFGRMSLGVGNHSSFHDTTNALELRAFMLKDMLLLVDDYHPSTTKKDADKMTTTRDSFIYSVANRTGRARLNSDSTDKGRYTARGIVIMTGEDIPSNPSALVRLALVETKRDHAYKNKLTELQKKVELLSNAMTAYIQFIEKNIDNIQKKSENEFQAFRKHYSSEKAHPRLPDQATFLTIGFLCGLDFLSEYNIIDDETYKENKYEAMQVFKDMINQHAERVDSQNPIKSFFEILNTLITQEKAFLKSKNFLPNNDGTLGGGELIGYFDEDYLYLLPEAALQTYERHLTQVGKHSPVSRQTLYKMLKEQGYIILDKEQATVREYLNGKRQRCLKVIKSKMNNLLGINEENS